MIKRIIYAVCTQSLNYSIFSTQHYFAVSLVSPKNLNYPLQFNGRSIRQNLSPTEKLGVVTFSQIYLFTSVCQASPRVRTTARSINISTLLLLTSLHLIDHSPPFALSGGLSGGCSVEQTPMSRF